MTACHAPAMRRAYTMLELLVVVAMMAILVALLVPAVQKVRQAASRIESSNNLKNIGLAFHNFHDVHKRLPFNGCTNDEGYNVTAAAGLPTTGSWAFQILPYVDQSLVFSPADSSPGDALPLEARSVGIAVYRCPGRGRPPLELNAAGVPQGAWSDYCINNYLNDPTQAHRMNNNDARRTLIGITDGSSNTIMVGHGSIDPAMYAATTAVAGSANIFIGGTANTARSCLAALAAGEPATTPISITEEHRDFLLTPDATATANPSAWGGPFPQGALFCLADGTVRMFPYSIVLGPYLTPTGNEIGASPEN